MRRIRYVPSQLLALVLFALVTLGMPSPPFAQFGISITIAPPMLPVYEQPVIPGPGYLDTGLLGLESRGRAAISGCRAHGCWRPRLGFCGLRAIGVGPVTRSAGIPGTGVRISASTAASTMDTATLVMATKAGTGITEPSSIIAR